MRMHTLAAVIAACACTTPAWAVYKCQDASGRTSFQEAPCAAGSKGDAIDIKPASGHAPNAPAGAAAQTSAPAASGDKPMTEADRLNAQAATIRKRNRLSDLKNLHIPAAYGAIDRAKRNCDMRMADLRERKGLANNNLAGATYQNSLSAEMQAVATQCESEQRRTSSDLDRLLAERKEIESSLAR